MTKIKKLAGTFVAAGALLTFTAPAAHAAPPEPFTITENIDFDAEIFEFTTTGGALCPSGTFEDVFIAQGGNDTSVSHTSKVNLQFRTVYTCDDGSGTFFARKHVFLTFSEDESSDNSGPISFHGGTGDYTTLSGHGVDVGHAEAGIGVGEISGVLKLG
ncbi:MAG TPA: hypothetical protein VNT27_09760 [Propionibacteriaceae bacterium]|nr:hypothetical protein [Propionibacteriaceae bacterium]